MFIIKDCFIAPVSPERRFPWPSQIAGGIVASTSVKNVSEQIDQTGGAFTVTATSTITKRRERIFTGFGGKIIYLPVLVECRVVRNRAFMVQMLGCWEMDSEMAEHNRRLGPFMVSRTFIIAIVRATSASPGVLSDFRQWFVADAPHAFTLYLRGITVEDCAILLWA